MNPIKTLIPKPRTGQPIPTLQHGMFYLAQTGAELDGLVGHVGEVQDDVAGDLSVDGEAGELVEIRGDSERDAGISKERMEDLPHSCRRERSAAASSTPLLRDGGLAA